jgi:predicted N-formylglutamate amidohydrolase
LGFLFGKMAGNVNAKRGRNMAAARPEVPHDMTFQPFETLPGALGRGLVLVADHAMRLFPAPFGTLGLPEAELDRHIAYDIGIEALTRSLAARLDAPAVMARFSRLLIDANRGEDDPTLIRRIYDRTIVPGNAALDAAGREARLDAFHRPYHSEVARLVAASHAASGRPPLVISLHSFTPQMAGGGLRPWHCGILWDKDPRAANLLLEVLRREPGLIVGDNEPYDGALKGDTMHRHCTSAGIAHGLIEVRQDLIADAGGVDEWAERLAPVLLALNARDELHRISHHASRAV